MVQKKRKLYLINWDLVCQPKVDGSLDIKKAKLLNDFLNEISLAFFSGSIEALDFFILLQI